MPRPGSFRTGELRGTAKTEESPIPPSATSCGLRAAHSTGSDMQRTLLALAIVLLLRGAALAQQSTERDGKIAINQWKKTFQVKKAGKVADEGSLRAGDGRPTGRGGTPGSDNSGA